MHIKHQRWILVQGIKEGAELPPPLTVDPHDLSEAERKKLGVIRLPATLDEAFANLDADTGALLPGVVACMLSMT